MPLWTRLLLTAAVVAAVAWFAHDPLLHVGEPVLIFQPRRGVTSGDVAAALIGLRLLVVVWWRT